MNKKIKRLYLILPVVTLAFLVAMVLSHLLRRDLAPQDAENPFQYDVSKFKTIDPKLITYREAGFIDLDLQAPRALAIGPDGRIHVAGDRSVVILDKDGRKLSAFKLSGAASCMAINDSGEIYVGINDHVEVYDRQGKRRATWPKISDNALITGLATAPGSVLVADAGAKLIRKYDLNGKPLNSWGKKDEDKGIPGFIIPSPYFEIHLAPDKTLWVANTGRYQLENYSLAGEFKSSWGKPEFGLNGFCGCCNPVSFAFLKDGRIVTSEKGIVRIKIYNEIGEISDVVAAPNQFAEGAIVDLAVDVNQHILALDDRSRRIKIFEKK